MQKDTVVCIGALVCCLLWGSSFPCIKIGYAIFRIKEEDIYSQILFGGLRFVCAGMIAVALGSLINKKLLVPKKGSLRKIFQLSLV